MGDVGVEDIIENYHRKDGGDRQENHRLTIE